MKSIILLLLVGCQGDLFKVFSETESSPPRFGKEPDDPAPKPNDKLPPIPSKSPDESMKVSIKRDHMGTLIVSCDSCDEQTNHEYALRAQGFAIGYAQGIDNFIDNYTRIMTSGTRAALLPPSMASLPLVVNGTHRFGADGLPLPSSDPKPLEMEDLVKTACLYGRSKERSQALLNQMPIANRFMVEGYVEGFNSYATRHVEKLKERYPNYAETGIFDQFIPIQATDIISSGHNFLRWGHLLNVGRAIDMAFENQKEPGPMIKNLEDNLNYINPNFTASNQVSVNGVTLADPHIPLTGWLNMTPYVIKGKNGINSIGGLFKGFVVPVIFSTDYGDGKGVSVSVTTNIHNLEKMSMVPENGEGRFKTYLTNGEFQDYETISCPYQMHDGTTKSYTYQETPEKAQVVYRSPKGDFALVKENEEVNNTDVNFMNAWIELNKSKSIREAVDNVLSTQHIPIWNVMMGQGGSENQPALSAYYFLSRTPYHNNPDIDYSKTRDFMNPEDDWKRNPDGTPVVIPFEKLPHVLVEEGSGKALVNCNEMPMHVVHPSDGSMATENYPKELFRGHKNFETDRGRNWRRYLDKVIEEKGEISYEDILLGSQEDQEIRFTETVIPGLKQKLEDYGKKLLSKESRRKAERNFALYFTPFYGSSSAEDPLAGYIALYDYLLNNKAFSPLAGSKKVEDPEMKFIQRELEVLSVVEEQYLLRWEKMTPWGELFQIWNGNPSFRFYSASGMDSSLRSFDRLLVDMPPFMGGSKFIAQGGQTHVQVSQYTEQGNRHGLFAPTQGGDLYDEPWYDKWTDRYSKKIPTTYNMKETPEIIDCTSIELVFNRDQGQLDRHASGPCASEGISIK